MEQIKRNQSSVEHFWKQLEEKGNAHIETEGVITVNITIDVNEYRLLQKQAKAMHKDEICKSYVYGSAYGIDVSNGLKPDKYYNETFGGNK